VIIFGAFAAGYAIPWDLGQDPSRVFLRVIFPLLISALLCGVAGFYSYRTVPGWRTWTWVALASMALNGIQFLVIPAMEMPVAVSIIIWISTIGLLICGILGQEKNSPLYKQPNNPNPGFKL
jgi:ABC-type multidrug transport system permease subunit